MGLRQPIHSIQDSCGYNMGSTLVRTAALFTVVANCGVEPVRSAVSQLIHRALAPGKKPYLQRSAVEEYAAPPNSFRRITASRPLPLTAAFGGSDSGAAALGTNTGRLLIGAVKAFGSITTGFTLRVYSRRCLGGKTTRRGDGWTSIRGKCFTRAGRRFAMVRDFGAAKRFWIIVRIRCNFSISAVSFADMPPGLSTVRAVLSGAQSTGYAAPGSQRLSLAAQLCVDHFSARSAKVGRSEVHNLRKCESI
jgi:hypothetical protein